METITVQPLGNDLVALAHCLALDATVFPHPSLPTAALRSVEAEPRVLVARIGEDARIVGHVSVVRDAGRLDIVGLAVAAGYRRAGVGRALLRAAIASARRQGLALRLHVSTANAGAIALYVAEGFVRSRMLRSFYSPHRFPNHGDAWEMVLPAP